MIFSRGSRTTGRHRHDASRADRSGQPSARPSTIGDQDHVSGAHGDRDAGTTAARPRGPYDIAEAHPDAPRLDLGSLRIPSVTGVQVRVQANPDGSVSRVVLVHEGSALQLTAFAAPRSEALWDEVRDEIRRQLFDQGVAVEEDTGDYGVELRARVRTKEGLKDLRFIGVDGPRWLVRADYQGPAAVDPSKSPQLSLCLHGLVVDRGNEARPAKEALPLRLSEKMAAQVQQQAAAASAARAGSVPATNAELT